MVFMQCYNGLYYYDYAEQGHLSMNMVKDNKKQYTRRRFKKAERAQKPQHVLQFPTTQEFKKTIRDNTIKKFWAQRRI